MKKSLLNNSFLVIGCLLMFNTSQAQSEPISSSYPNVTMDYAETLNHTVDVKIRFTMPGVIGAGFAASYFKPNLFHVYGEAGAGWTFRVNKEDEARNWVMPWGRVKAGYPLHISSHGSAKWYTSIGSTTANYYKVDVPVHHYLIPEIGLHINPVTYPTGVQAPVITAGLSWRTIVDSKVAVKDSYSGDIETGYIFRNSDVQVGLLFAAKDQLDLSEVRKVDKSEGTGWYVYFSFPHQNINYDIGVNTLGYNDKDNREAASQFYFGMTIHISN